MLRQAVTTDLENIFQIYMDPTVNPFMSWEVMSLEEFRPIYQTLLATNALYVYEVDHTTAAVIRLERRTHRLSHIAYIGGFGVGAHFQNRGLGSRIMKEAISKLHSEGVKRIELIVEADNPRAISLYEKTGFVREGTLRRFFKRESQSTFVDDYYYALFVD